MLREVAGMFMTLTRLTTTLPALRWKVTIIRWRVSGLD
jgi:hypothetical protein